MPIWREKDTTLSGIFSFISPNSRSVEPRASGAVALSVIPNRTEEASQPEYIASASDGHRLETIG